MRISISVLRDSHGDGSTEAGISDLCRRLGCGNTWFYDSKLLSSGQHSRLPRSYVRYSRMKVQDFRRTRRNARDKTTTAVSEKKGYGCTKSRTGCENLGKLSHYAEEYLDFFLMHFSFALFLIINGANQRKVYTFTCFAPFLE